MKKLISAITLVLSTLCNTGIQASGDKVGVEAAMDDRYCTSCHGVKGIGNIAIEAPRLAGMEAWYLKRQLENFRSGVRGTHGKDIQGIAMQAMAAKLSDESITDILDWVGDWAYVPAEVTIEGNVNEGRAAYQTCAACHGVLAEGNEALGAPALAGQNDWYMITQLRNYRAGFRGSHQEDTDGKQMLTMSQTLRDDQAVINVVSYINTLQRD
jgi:cytochrome c553